MAATAEPARGQHAATSSQFVLLQAGFWTPPGADSTAVPTSIAMLLLTPDSGSPVARVRAFSFNSEPFNPFREWTEPLTIERDGRGRFHGMRTEWSGVPVRSIYDSRPDIGLPAGDVPSLLAQAGAWLGAVFPGPTGVWRDTIEQTLAFEDDTVIFRHFRGGRRIDRDSGPGGGPWRMVAGGSVQITRRLGIEYPIERGGVLVQIDLSGPVTESFLYWPGRYEADSIHVEGLLTGTIVFEHRTRKERRDTVVGRWTFSQIGVWEQEGDSLWDHLLDQEGIKLGRGRSLRSLDLTRLPFDSLLGRRRTATAFERIMVESVLDSLLNASPNQVQPTAGNDPYSAVVSLRRTLENPYRSRVSAGDARQLASAFLLTTMRRRLVARPALLADALVLLENGKGVSPDAGPVLAEAARQADDAYARDILLLGAYRADPPRYREVLEREASKTMYGRVAREYVHGNAEWTALHIGLGPLADDTTWYWGLDARDSSRGARFPGVDAPVTRLRAFLDYRDRGPGPARQVGRSSEDRSATPVREWLASHAPDGQQILRRRFAAEPDPEARLTLSRLLLLLADSTPLPWLEATVESGAEASSEQALGLLSPRPIPTSPWPPDESPDGRARRSGMQEVVLKHLYGEGWSDATVVVAEELTPDAARRWAERVRLVPNDSVKVITERSGRQQVLFVLAPRAAGRWCVVEYKTSVATYEKHILNLRDSKTIQLVLDQCGAAARLVRQLPVK